MRFLRCLEHKTHNDIIIQPSICSVNGSTEPSGIVRHNDRNVLPGSADPTHFLFALTFVHEFHERPERKEIVPDDLCSFHVTLHSLKKLSTNPSPILPTLLSAPLQFRKKIFLAPSLWKRHGLQNEAWCKVNTCSRYWGRIPRGLGILTPSPPRCDLLY